MSSDEDMVIGSNPKSGKDEIADSDFACDTIATQEHKKFIARTISEFANKSHGKFTDKTLQLEVVKEFNEKFNANITINDVRREIENIRKNHTLIRKRNTKTSEANYKLSKLKENLINEAKTKRFRSEANTLLQVANNITEEEQKSLSELQKVREKAWNSLQNRKIKQEPTVNNSQGKITNHFHVISKSESGLHVKLKASKNLFDNDNSNSNSMDNTGDEGKHNTENLDPNKQLDRVTIMKKLAGNAATRQKELDEQNKLRTQFLKVWTEAGNNINKMVNLEIRIKEQILQQSNQVNNNFATNSNSNDCMTPMQAQRNNASA